MRSPESPAISDMTAPRIVDPLYYLHNPKVNSADDEWSNGVTQLLLEEMAKTDTGLKQPSESRADVL